MLAAPDWQHPSTESSTFSLGERIRKPFSDGSFRQLLGLLEDEAQYHAHCNQFGRRPFG